MILIGITRVILRRTQEGLGNGGSGHGRVGSLVGDSDGREGLPIKDSNQLEKLEREVPMVSMRHSAPTNALH